VRRAVAEKAWLQIPYSQRSVRCYSPAMLKDKHLVDDLAKMFSGAAGAAMDMRRELEALVADKIERVFARGHYVTREEFEVVRDMAAKARAENERLSAELAKLRK
jgi:BMFP domain-containing protein YqiC